jgi:hypothetical protein
MAVEDNIEVLPGDRPGACALLINRPGVRGNPLRWYPLTNDQAEALASMLSDLAADGLGLTIAGYSHGPASLIWLPGSRAAVFDPGPSRRGSPPHLPLTSAEVARGLADRLLAQVSPPAPEEPSAAAERPRDVPKDPGVLVAALGYRLFCGAGSQDEAEKALQILADLVEALRSGK